ncbi:tRNA lysidine(34) synthetase TilS [Alkalimonas mucilaginosa]|uniref:tRNA(Ile)-lysidine synthase n=1 Tax=Alkalimonas mucilaginosa TaxID=3057676 RepID=A0ABU7JFX0_9GAMM|nr:tRNA lysidine(34) synthetase TilS [Alkalimonas sp. MEB004]MEE2024587.1 tRNA lysidine(34) synthetase TilS [Alkalimonas sp. MEB004]
MTAAQQAQTSRQLEETLAACLHRYQPQQVVLALSGGMDSMVLLELLHRLRQSADWQLKAVHVHHGLHALADDWLAFCQRQCAQRAIPFLYHKIQLAGRHNLEARARTARYQQLEQYCSQADSLVLTAHHADDQLETLLLALKRGSGLAGLSGIAAIRPFNKGYLLRPLLSISRTQLESFAAMAQLAWVDDPSNQDTGFDRNFLRQKVVPVLQQRWPDFAQTAARSMAHCADAQQQLQQQWQQQLRPFIHDKGQVLQLAALHGKERSVRNALLRCWLGQFQLNPELAWLDTLHHEVIAAKADASPQLAIQGWQIRRYQQALYLTKAVPELAADFELFWCGQEVLDLPAGLGQLHFVYAESPPAAGWLPLPATTDLLVCFGRLSLSFKPAGALHSKPLKQWCKHWQLAPWQRPLLPLLLNDNQLIAVAGKASAVAAESATLWCRFTQP